MRFVESEKILQFSIKAIQGQYVVYSKESPCKLVGLICEFVYGSCRDRVSTFGMRVVTIFRTYHYTTTGLLAFLEEVS